MRRLLVLLGALWVLAATPASQEASLEYRVKAAFLFNFTRFAEWPPQVLAGGTTFNLCLARTNPFGPALTNTIDGEAVGGRPLAARIVDRDVTGCHILFVPRGVTAAPYLKQVSTAPVLTVGESPGFLEDGGIINFVLLNGRVRFEIDQQSAARRQIKLSARLLQLALAPQGRDGD